ncbi:MAG: RagB/SusD family nutrient uptake outer membrane protein [Prevotella sp.]|nr:RagB/SusD family nutrient uptake outer membrane protein [Prevotella sp.]MDY4038007.1 RagB/SusD family nutrient uptake outer membrane protein [Prevotella sp.]
MLSQPNTVDYANYTYNEIIDRGVLAISDVRYESAYKYINYMNVLLNKLLDAQGDEVKKKQLVAEAHVIRAWLHFLLVNIYAKQYDAGTADKEGGIPYVEDVDVSQEKTKLTLEEIYRHILADLADDFIAELPDESNNVERADKAFAYAAKAYVLMQMKRYADAIPYAQASLKINNTIDARETLVQSGAWIITQNVANNLLYIGGSGRVSLTFDVISKETWEKFEDGDYVVNYDAAGGWSTFMGPMMSGIEGTALYQGWTLKGNVYGITGDHVYYVLAECLIRTGKIKEGLQYVDRVRRHRVENYKPFAQDNLNEMQAMALLQKAKWVECICSFENFFDSKRWNSEPDYAKTITRALGSYGTFSIKPDSKLWVLPFPLNATRKNPSLTQNY